MGARPLLRNARHRTMITPVNPPRLRLIHISPSYQTVHLRLKLFSNGYCPLDWNSNPMFYANTLLQKNIQSDMNEIEKILNCRGQLGLQWMSRCCERYFFIHVTCKLNAEGQHETKIYEHCKGPMERARVNNLNH